MGGAPQPQGPVTLRELLGGIRDEFLQWDRGLIGTFIALLWRPASVARGFLNDRDPRYVKPWRYLVVSIAVSVAAQWFAFDQLGLRAQLSDPERQMRQASFLLDNAALLTLVVLPLIAAAMRLFYIGLKVRYVDTLVLLCYTQGQTNLLRLTGIALLALNAHAYAQMALGVALIAYLVWAWAGFGAGPWWRRLLAALLSLVAAEAINTAVVLGILRMHATVLS